MNINDLKEIDVHATNSCPTVSGIKPIKIIWLDTSEKIQ